MCFGLSHRVHTEQSHGREPLGSHDACDDGQIGVEVVPSRPSRALQQDTQLWLFFEPRLSRSATVSGNGEIRWTGPLAMSAVV